MSNERDETTSMHRFFQSLNALAAMCSFELSEILLEQYDRHLSGYGYEDAAEAIEHIIANRDTHDKFPSVKAIINAINPASNELDAPYRVAELLLKNVRGKGRYWPSELKSWDAERKLNITFDQLMEREMGEVATITVHRMGGWIAVCESANNNNLSYFRKQVIDTAKSVIESIKNRSIAAKPKISDFLPSAKEPKLIAG